jgi:hypothetical protein
LTGHLFLFRVLLVFKEIRDYSEKSQTNKEAAMKEYRMVTTTMLLMAILMIMGCGTSRYYVERATPVAGPSPEKALIYFMRPSGYNPNSSFQIWDGDHFVGIIPVHSYLFYECDPGTHLFIGIAENKVALEADLAAGKSYYVGTNARMGWAKARMELTPVTRGSELWDKMEEYKKGLNCLSTKEEARAKWEADKKQEVLALRDYFTTGAGKAQVFKLSQEDGR